MPHCQKLTRPAVLSQRHQQMVNRYSFWKNVIRTNKISHEGNVLRAGRIGDTRGGRAKWLGGWWPVKCVSTICFEIWNGGGGEISNTWASNMGNEKRKKFNRNDRRTLTKPSVPIDFPRGEDKVEATGGKQE